MSLQRRLRPRYRYGLPYLPAVVAVALGLHLLWEHTAASGNSPAHAPATAAFAAGAAGDPQQVKFASDAPQLAMVRVEVLSPAPLPVSEPLSGRLTYDDNFTARVAAGYAGRLLTVLARPGDTVRRGQRLADVDSPDYASAVADLERARADEQRKSIVFDRAQRLVPGESIASKDWELAQADLALARAETARALQRVQYLSQGATGGASTRLGILSPLQGVVTERTASPGQELQPGEATPLFVVSDLHHLWVAVDLPERLLASVRRGATLSVESDAYPGEHFQAEVMDAGRIVDPNTRRITLRATLQNPDLRLLPEMYVRATLVDTRARGIAVPNAALVTEGVRNYVYVQSAPGVFRRQAVELATRGGEVSYVSTGLNAKDAVVTSGALLIDAERDLRSAGS